MFDYSKDTLIKASINDDFIALVTYDRDHARYGRFLIDGNRFWHWCTNRHPGTLFDKDMGDFLEVRHDDAQDVYRFTLTHVNTYGDGRIGNGWQKQFYMTDDDVWGNLRVGKPVVRLCHEQVCVSPVYEITSQAQKRIADMRNARNSHDRQQYAAFKKCLMRHFNRRNRTVLKLYRDGKDDFYFEEVENSRGTSMCGGINHFYRNDTSKHTYSVNT